MNGIISRSFPRIFHITPDLIAGAVTGCALLAGFATGTALPVLKFSNPIHSYAITEFKNPFSWVLQATASGVRFNSEVSTVVIAPVPFKKFHLSKTRNVNKAVDSTSPDDFILAYHEMKYNFFSLMSGSRKQQTNEKSVWRSIKKPSLIPPVKMTIKAAAIALASQSEKPKAAEQNKVDRAVEIKVPAKAEETVNKVVTTQPAPPVIKAANSVPVAVTRSEYQAVNPVVKPTVNLTVNHVEAQKIVVESKNEFASTEPAELTSTQKFELIEKLQGLQLQATQDRRIASQLAAAPVTVNDSISDREYEPSQQDQVAAPNHQQQDNGFMAQRSVSDNKCETLSTHRFEMPGATLDTQFCPEKVEWISKEIVNKTLKSNLNRGWVKIYSDPVFATMTRHPAPNEGATLLLDQNSIALLGMRSGVTVEKSLGIVAGLLPSDYEVDLVARSENVQIFESGGRKFFVYLNVEPGASALNLTPKKSLDEKNADAATASVFAPVLAGVITYLDLSAPKLSSFKVQIQKRNQSKDEEISGLQVSISTQENIFAVTDAYGFATFNQVPIMPGFPLYIDVRSKNGAQEGATYRYEIKRPNRNGIYQFRQYPDRLLSKYAKQWSTNGAAQDQAGYVIGRFHRKRLDGFKHYYSIAARTLTEKLDFNPKLYSINPNDNISATNPLEGDNPRFVGYDLPEGLSQIELLNEGKNSVFASLIPVSPRVIYVLSE